VYVAVFGGYVGMQVLTPILPPLARELRLTEFQLGVITSASAVTIALVSPVWGQRSDQWGRRPVFVAALAGTTVGLLAFAVVAQLGFHGVLAVPVLFAALLVVRGVLVGGAIAGLPVGAQSYVADVTTDERSRVRGVARVGASVGLALVLGPALGGLLGGVDLLTALYVAPALLAVTTVVVLAALPAEPARTDRARAPRLSPFDPRLWPFLLTGLGIYLSINLLQLSLGFLLQDRGGLTSEQTAGITGLALLLGGIPMLLVQAVVIPKLNWSPVRLLRVGIPITASAFVVIAAGTNIPTMLVGVTLSGLGHSLCVPGYNAAPTLLVARHEQGGVAGLIGTTNAVSLIIGPLVATALYSAWPPLPFVVGAAELLLVTAFVLLHPGVRRTAETPDAPSATG
jgi:MFS family permease